MDRNTLEKALSYISDQHIANAVKTKRKRPYWVAITAAATAAAILALVLLHGMLPQNPQPQPEYRILANEVRLAATPRVHARPSRQDYGDIADFQTALDSWHTKLAAQRALKNDALGNLDSFFSDSSAIFLSGEGNQLWSPVNAYIELAMLSELTAGSSQQQILNLLGTKDILTLRQHISAIFRSAYCSDENGTSKIANSLWLQDGLFCNFDTLNTLSSDYYTSIYSGELDSNEIGNAIADWLEENTGGLLVDYPPEKLNAPVVSALYSTIYFQSQWLEAFPVDRNVEDLFHSPTGDRIATYMRRSCALNYCRGDNYGAVCLALKNGGSMWFILPDANSSVQDVLQNKQYINMVLSQEWENKQYVKANLKVPKFDVSGKKSLTDGLKQLGVTDIFSGEDGNFSSFTTSPLYISTINQAVRVQIDEEGVTGAAYTETLSMGMQPPTDIIDFTLDRPFLFVVERDNIPLFTGVVNNP